MGLATLVVAAIVLSVERASYVWIARATGTFQRLCRQSTAARFGEPITIVQELFCAFKVVQVTVFVGWCYWHGHGSLVPTADVVALGIGGAAIVAGQVLNGSVAYRLGRVGVFYGDRLGYEVPWCQAFPFSLCAHPQYVGTVLTIWGFFLVMRFPHDDWYLLPALETVYYVVGTALEEGGTSSDLRRRGSVQGGAVHGCRAGAGEAVVEGPRVLERRSGRGPGVEHPIPHLQ